MTSRVYSLDPHNALQEQASPIKRKAKIFAKKLPEDFFQVHQLSRESQAASLPRAQVQTHAYHRKIPELTRISQTRQVAVRRGNLSSRLAVQPQTTTSLILGVLNSSRNMRKVIRKHSLQLKERDTNLIPSKAMHLELPPLMIKKGVASHF